MNTQRPTIIIIFQLIMVSCFGQQFIAHPVLPFNIQTVKQDSSRKAQSIFFFDYDQDGDRDLFLTGFDYFDNVPNLKWINLHFFIEMQENTGSNKNPQFGPRQDVFQQFPYPVGYFFASGGDLTGDQKMDLMTTADIDYIGNEKISMLKNTGATGTGEFQVSNLQSMGLEDFVAESFYVPHLTDLDQDGDLDLVVSGFDSAFGEEDGPNVANLYYARNTGTKNVPFFEGWYSNPYDFTPDPQSEVLTSGDIDNDGDVDLIGGLIGIPADSANYLTLHLNSPGGNGKPAFPTMLKSPFGMPTSFGNKQLSFPTLADMDDDGDLDLFVFIGTSQASTLHYYENNLCQPTTQDQFVSLCEGESVTIGGQSYSVAGTYTINLQNIHQCDSIINLTLEVLPVQTSSIDASICEGDTYLVGNESFSLPGSYMVLVTSANGCDSIVFLTLTVHVVDVSLTQADHLLAANQAGATYQWLDCDSGQDIPGATGQSYDVTITGNYAVRITDGLGCTAVSACIPVTITGLKEELIANGISLYPNPVNGIVFIKNQTSFPITNLSIMDVSGKMKGAFFPDSKNSIDLSALGTGVYFIKIQMDGNEVIKQIVVK